jgi:hypothetical protein
MGWDGMGPSRHESVSGCQRLSEIGGDESYGTVPSDEVRDGRFRSSFSDGLNRRLLEQILCLFRF